MIVIAFLMVLFALLLYRNVDILELRISGRLLPPSSYSEHCALGNRSTRPPSPPLLHHLHPVSIGRLSRGHVLVLDHLGSTSLTATTRAIDLDFG